MSKMPGSNPLKRSSWRLWKRAQSKGIGRALGLASVPIPEGGRVKRWCAGLASAIKRSAPGCCTYWHTDLTPHTRLRHWPAQHITSQHAIRCYISFIELAPVTVILWNLWVCLTSILLTFWNWTHGVTDCINTIAMKFKKWGLFINDVTYLLCDRWKRIPMVFNLRDVIFKWPLISTYCCFLMFATFRALESNSNCLIDWNFNI